MLIISVRDNENNSLKRKEKTNKETNSEKNKAGRGGSYSERVRAEWFFKAIKLSGFLQLICKVSVILSRI